MKLPISRVLKRLGSLAVFGSKYSRWNFLWWKTTVRPSSLHPIAPVWQLLTMAQSLLGNFVADALCSDVALPASAILAASLSCLALKLPRKLPPFVGNGTAFPSLETQTVLNGVSKLAGACIQPTSRAPHRMVTSLRRSWRLDSTAGRGRGILALPGLVDRIDLYTIVPWSMTEDPCLGAVGLHGRPLAWGGRVRA